MKRVYVAGPYRAKDEVGVHRNILAADRIGMEIMGRGDVAIVPHKLFANWGGLADDAVFLRTDIWLMQRCDAVVVVPGWETSSGTKAEIAEAEKRGIPVFYWPETP